MTVTRLLSATALLALLFGVGLALMPDVLLGIFGVTLDVTGVLFARNLGGAWLGYALLNWQAREASTQTRRAVVQADLIVAAFGVVLSLYAISTFGGALMWLWVALFVVFIAWQGFVLWVRPERA